MIVKNALIENATLTVLDCGLLAIRLSLNLGDSGRCDYSILNLGTNDPMRNLDNNQCGYSIAKLFEVVGVRDFSELKGRPIRAIFENDGGACDGCIGIQHFIHRGIFFIPGLLTTESLEDILDPFDNAMYERYKGDCVTRQNIIELRNHINA